MPSAFISSSIIDKLNQFPDSAMKNCSRSNFADLKIEILCRRAAHKFKAEGKMFSLSFFSLDQFEHKKYRRKKSLR